MGHPAAEPEKLGYCIDLVSGNANARRRNYLEEVEVVFICVLNQAAEVAISAPASDLPGSRGRGTKYLTFCTGPKEHARKQLPALAPQLLLPPCRGGLSSSEVPPPPPPNFPLTHSEYLCYVNMYRPPFISCSSSGLPLSLLVFSRPVQRSKFLLKGWAVIICKFYMTQQQYGHHDVK